MCVNISSHVRVCVSECPRSGCVMFCVPLSVSERLQAHTLIKVKRGKANENKESDGENKSESVLE